MTISITLFGPFQVTVDGVDITNFRSDKARALLAYVAAQRDQAHSRDALATLLWGEQDDTSAKTNLRNVLSNVRKVTESAESGPALDITRQHVQLLPAVAVDSASFEALLASTEQHTHQDVANCAHCVAVVKQALDLYRGDFLAHLYTADAPDFDDWSATLRENLHQQAADALRFIADYHTARGEYAAAMPYARRLSEMEPWEEDVHAQLMRLLAWQGQRTAALRHYDAVCRVLDEELGVEPSAEFVQLHQKIENAATDRPHNLPAQATTFIGRNEELAQVTAHLAHSDRRLITLVGAGGVGKTRLALEAARRVADDYLGPFLDGVFFVSLAGVDSADFVPNAVADALGVTLSGQRTPGREVAAYLRRRQLLLILDNLEHLLQDDRLVTWLESLLRDAPHINLLITSREALSTGAEWLIDLNGLTYPQLIEPQSAETIIQYDAVALFVQRVQQLNRSFELSAQTSACTLSICQLVNGVPLAIELAAGWIKLLSCNEIAVEIGRSIDILASNRRDLPPRHRSMRAVFDYSWVLLPSAEQQALMALSVFRGTFDRAAATAVTSISLITLDELLSKSWLRVVASETAPSENRYQMLEPQRQYSAEQLSRSPEQNIAVRDRHARHFLTIAASFGDALQGENQSAALKALRNEIDNLRAAWLWATERNQYGLLDSALNALFNYYEIRSFFREGRQLLAHTFDAISGEGRVTGSEPFVARLEARLGWLLFYIGEPDSAAAHLGSALVAARSLGLEEEITFDLNYLGAIARHQGRFDNAETFLQEALATAQVSGDQFGASIALNNLSQVAVQHGDLELAQRLAHESLTLKEALGDRRGSAFSHLYLAQINTALGELDAAQQQFATAAAIYAALDDKRGMALTQRSLGDAYLQVGDNSAAIVAYSAAVRLFDAIGLVTEADQLREQLNRLSAE